MKVKPNDELEREKSKQQQKTEKRKTSISGIIHIRPGNN